MLRLPFRGFKPKRSMKHHVKTQEHFNASQLVPQSKMSEDTLEIADTTRLNLSDLPGGHLKNQIAGPNTHTHSLF